MSLSLRSGVFIVALVCSISNQLVAQITSDFAASADGWTVFDTSTGASIAPTYTASGGNPTGSGEISYGTLSTAVGFYFTAPAKFKGNLSAAYNQNLTFDLHTSYPGADNSLGDVIVTNSAVAGASLYYQLPGKPPYMGYTGGSYTIQLIETFAGWHYGSMTGATPTSAQMKLVLGNVTGLQIREKYYTANTFTVYGYLDNVSVGITPPTVTTQPTPIGVCEGANATLTTAATGNPSITYQWQKQSSSPVAILWSDIANGGGYSNVTTSTLTVNTTGNFGAGNYRCKISGLYATDVYSNSAAIGIYALPTAPTTTGGAGCSPASVILTAAGGTAGQYRWYTVATNGTAIAGQTNSTYTTPSLTTSAPYYAAINNGTCESLRTAVTATINTPPAAPATTGSASCTAGTITLAAGGGTNGQYRWYTTSTGGTAIAGQTSSTYSPTLTATTTYYVSIDNGTCEGARTAVTGTIYTSPNAPVTTGAASCVATSFTLTATGGSAGQYRWYTSPTGVTAIAGQTNSNYVTPSLSTTTDYYVAINDGTCESNRTKVTATVNTPPGAPVATGVFTCIVSSVTLTAAGGANGQYRWYTVPSGGTALSNETSSTYTTPPITATTTYYVSINNGPCEGNRTAVTATLGDASCPSNEPPVIAPTPISAPIEGKVSLNLTALITDKDNNLDLTTLKVTVPPSSGASATIDSKFNLILDYTGISFSGTEKLTIQVCDKAGACTQRELNVEVVGDIKIYNALSPNNDGKNEYFLLQYIDVLDNTKKNKVTIFGRWGDVLFEVEDYNNNTKVFKGLNNHGEEIPSGTYFYKIEFAGNKKSVSGYLTLKR